LEEKIKELNNAAKEKESKPKQFKFEGKLQPDDEESNEES
jgi:hypothetical protein